MALPKVQVVLEVGGSGRVLVDGVELPGVQSVQLRGAVREIPQVVVTLTPGQVLADVDQASVTVLRAGPGATEFADQLNPARLEGLALQHIDANDGTTGEGFAAAVAQMAAEFDQAHGD